MPKSAISFKVPSKLWNAFKTQTDGLFLSRAPFLNYMVKKELPNLSQDLAGLKLSTAAKRYIMGELGRKDLVSVNIEVEPETADYLRATMKEHNLVRDAFMCRLIVFLRCTDGLLDWLEVPKTTRGSRHGGYLEDIPASPLGAMEAVRDDPFYYVRNHVVGIYKCGVHRVPLMRGAEWAACYLEDEDVPSTRAFKKRQKDWDLSFSLLDSPAGVGKPPSTRKSGASK